MNLFFIKLKWLLLFLIIIIGYAAIAVTPQKLQVSYVVTPFAANGVYVKQSGTMGSSGLEYWKHEARNLHHDLSLVAPTIDIEKIVLKNNKTTKIVVVQGEALKYNNEAFTNIHVQSVSGWKNLYLCI